MSNERRTTAGRIASGLIVLLALAVGGTASAKTYFIAGGGGQLAIGGGLPLPIQVAPAGTTTGPTAWAGTNFPPLLIPVVPGATLSATTVMASNQQLTVPAGVLSRAAAVNTLGQFGQNPNLYAVRTDLAYSWPAVPAVLNTANRLGNATTVYSTTLGGALPAASSVTYTAPPTGKFGGPAQFRITPGATVGLIPGSPVTVFAIAVKGPGNPACTHTALTPVPFPGPGTPACVAALLPAAPNTLAQVGAPAGSIASTLPVNPVPGIGIGKFGPNGDVTFFTFTPAMTMAGPTNMATSAGFPFTVGQLKIQAPSADGSPETFTITGKDSRTAGGQGTIQLVAASLSQRTQSLANANRGWVSLTLTQSEPVPTMNEWARIATITLMAALTVGFFVVRRRGEAL